MFTQEQEDALTRLIQESAEALGCIFIEESGEGRDLVLPDIYLEDVSGWLCPIGTPVEEQRDNKWASCAEWYLEDGEPKIKFVPMPVYDMRDVL